LGGPFSLHATRVLTCGLSFLESEHLRLLFSGFGFGSTLLTCLRFLSDGRWFGVGRFFSNTMPLLQHQLHANTRRNHTSMPAGTCLRRTSRSTTGIPNNAFSSSGLFFRSAIGFLLFMICETGARVCLGCSYSRSALGVLGRNGGGFTS